MSDTTAGSRNKTALTDVTPGRWTLDPSASSVALQHKTMWGMVTVKGVFTKVTGEGELLADGSAHGTVTVDAASVDTKNVKRDVHLRSADFFDTDKHPSLTFTATGVTAGGDGTAQVKGELTVRDTTGPLSFTAKASKVSPDAVTLDAELTVDRKDFGLTWNQLGMMKDITTLTLALSFTRQPE